MKKLRLLLVAVLAFTMLAGTVAQAEDLANPSRSPSCTAGTVVAPISPRIR